MATKARFFKAASNSRPHASHRFDVFGPKLDRNVTLFGKCALEAWVELEADSSVQAYCERPLVIPDCSPHRVVDFWVQFADREELWLLTRTRSEPALDTPQDVFPAFVAWATAQRMRVRFIPSSHSTQQTLFQENWGHIIREVSSNRRYITSAMRARTRESFSTPRPLSILSQLFPDDDPVLLRTAAFCLIHTGHLRALDIANRPLGPPSLLEAV